MTNTVVIGAKSEYCINTIYCGGGCCDDKNDILSLTVMTKLMIMMMLIGVVVVMAMMIMIMLMM